MGYDNPYALSGEINLFSYAAIGPEEFFSPSYSNEKKGQIEIQVTVIEDDSDSSHSEEQFEQKEWKPSSRELFIMITLAIISLMVALDANVIVTSLAVRYCPCRSWNLRLSLPEHNTRS